MNDIKGLIITHARALWRRRWYAILIAWLVSCVGWGYVITLPDQYKSQARVYINTQSMLDPLLRGIAVQNNMQQQIDFMRRTLLSRPNLEQVIRTTDLGLRVENDQQMEALIDRLTRDIRLQSQGRDLLHISYTDHDPRIAQRVTQSVLNIFVESNLGENRADMENAQTFIENQVAEYERKLRQAEARLANFKAENMDLISGTGSFVSRAEAARNRVQEAERALEDSIAERNRLREQLAAIPEYISVESMPQVIVNGSVVRNPKADLAARIRDRESELDRMLSVYTEQHPDVIALQRQIEYLEAEYAEMEEAPVDGENGRQTTQVPNGLYEQIKLRLVEAEARVATNEKRLRRAQEDREAIESRAQAATEVEAKLADLNRDYGVVKSNYEALLSRRESASIAQAVDSDQEIQFRIVDAPQIPTQPSGPNRPLFMTVVILIGLGAGGGFAFLLAQMDDSFSTTSKLRDTYGLPVLGAVSAIVGKAHRRWRRTELAGFATSVLVLCAIYGALVVTNPKLPDGLSNFNFSGLI